MQNKINATIIFLDKSAQIALNHKHNLQEFKAKLSKLLSLPDERISIYYNNVKLPEVFSGTIGDIVNDELRPLFIVKSEINRHDPIGSYHQRDFIHRVSIKCFPSRPEIFAIVDNFLNRNQLPRKYFSDNQANEIIISFDSSDTAFAFVKYMNMVKIKENLYRKIRVCMYLGINPLRLSKSINKPETSKSRNIEEKTDLSIKESNGLSVVDKSSIMRYKHNSIDMNSYKKQNQIDHGKQSLLLMIEKYNFREDNKSKWIAKKNFNNLQKRGSLY